MQLFSFGKWFLLNSTKAKPPVTVNTAMSHSSHFSRTCNRNFAISLYTNHTLAFTPFPIVVTATIGFVVFPWASFRFPALKRGTYWTIMCKFPFKGIFELLLIGFPLQLVFNCMSPVWSPKFFSLFCCEIFCNGFWWISDCGLECAFNDDIFAFESEKRRRWMIGDALFIFFCTAQSKTVFS